MEQLAATLLGLLIYAIVQIIDLIGELFKWMQRNPGLSMFLILQAVIMWNLGVHISRLEIRHGRAIDNLEGCVQKLQAKAYRDHD